MDARVFRDGGPPSTATVALIPCEPACRTKMEVPDPSRFPDKSREVYTPVKTAYQ
jgi:hypothetical protein